MRGVETSYERDPDLACVEIHGDVDLLTVTGLKREVLEVMADSDGSGMKLDLSSVAFIDSTGLGMLVDLRKAALDAPLDLHIVNVPDHVQRLFEITGLTEIFADASRP